MSPGGHGVEMGRSTIQPGTAAAEEHESAGHRSEGDPAGLGMKSVLGYVGKSAVSDEHERRYSQEFSTNIVASPTGINTKARGKMYSRENTIATPP